MKKSLIIPVIAALAGCATHLSQQACMETNWHQEGFNDAVNGRFPRNLASAEEDCAKFGIPVSERDYRGGWQVGAKAYCSPPYNLGYQDGQAGKSREEILNRLPLCQQAGVLLSLVSYEKGRLAGLRLYCTYDNGVMLAKLGRPMPTVCPSSLQQAMNKGWMLGKEQFCNQPQNAFALGKEGKPYPELCTEPLYVAFKSEYDRGLMISERMNHLQTEINDLNSKMNYPVLRYQFEQTSTEYQLGHDKSPEAIEALQNVNTWNREKKMLENELFNFKVMR